MGVGNLREQEGTLRNPQKARNLDLPQCLRTQGLEVLS
jgi:hypothetical protein